MTPSLGAVSLHLVFSCLVLACGFIANNRKLVSAIVVCFLLKNPVEEEVSFVFVSPKSKTREQVFRALDEYIRFCNKYENVC